MDDAKYPDTESYAKDSFTNKDVKLGRTIRIRLPVDYVATRLDQPDYLAIARDLNNT